MKKPLPIGIEFYKEMIEKDYYYVDKTLLMKELLDYQAKVSLFTRPRRFGKTLALQMLKVFFEDERDAKGNPLDNRHYFDGKKISSCGEHYLKHMGQYPVISLSLKSAKQPTFDMAYKVLRQGLCGEFGRHLYVLGGDALTEKEKAKYMDIYEERVDADGYATSLAFLSECLKKYHGKSTVILLDEYDVPLENAWFSGFYDEMIGFIRSLFESSLKTNTSLEFSVITGCLRISKESIFTGLNNLKIHSITDGHCAEHFGFTPEEVKIMLDEYALTEKSEGVQKWYDGYLFGETEVYNPWSILNYVDDNKERRSEIFRPYWSNTSSNSIIRELVDEASPSVREEIEGLLAGGTIEKQIHEDITYGDIHQSQDNLWNFLFFTGYLKKISERQENYKIYMRMGIPNAEIHYIYQNMILSWFERKVENTDRSAFMRAIEEGDCETFGNFLSDQLLDTISFFDYGESYYHGFMAGLIKGAGRYLVLSNRESGTGRPDLLVKSPTLRGKAFVMEVKLAKTYNKLEAACQEALCQAEEQNYRAELEQEGYSDITVYGIGFYRKECMVKKLEK